MPKKKKFAVPKPPVVHKIIQKEKNNNAIHPLHYEVHPHLGWLVTASIAFSSFFIMITVIAQEKIIPLPENEIYQQSKKIIENPSIQNDYPPSAQTPATTDTREDTSGKTIQQDLQGSSEVEICNFYGIELPGKCEDYQELINPLSEENINSASAGQ